MNKLFIALVKRLKDIAKVLFLEFKVWFKTFRK